MPRILIVDDEARNRELIHAYFEGDGHELIDAESGEKALVIAAAHPPDLVLLDIMMQGMDGYATCVALKAHFRGQFLPIILITALHEHASRLRGLASGADEFLTKPVDRQELILRVNNLLALREKEIALIEKNTQHAELHRFKDEMSAMIVHDLKNPLSAVLSNLDYVIETPHDLHETSLEALRDARTASRRAIGLIQNLLDVARMEGGRIELRKTPTSIAGLFSSVVRQRCSVARSRAITIRDEVDPATRLDADADLVLRVIENLFDNSLRYTPSGGHIHATSALRGDNAQIQIGNTGPPIPKEARELIFEKFGRSMSGTGRMHLGLGLYFCRLAAEAHGGRIWVEETAALPTVFTLEMPMSHSAV